MKDQRLSGEERQDLVAYLDGEVEPSLTEKIELKIANSVSARMEVEALRRTWELLDFLKLPETSGTFTARTMELIGQEGKRKVALGRSASALGRQVAAAAVWLAALAGCVAIAGAAVYFWPDPNRRLVQDLPVLERYDAYRAVGSIDFLKQLQEMKLLDDIDGASPPDN